MYKYDKYIKNRHNITMKKYIKKNIKEILLLLFILLVSLYNMKKAPLLSSKYNSYFIKQLIWIVIGIILYIFIYKIKFKYIFKIRYFLYALNILLLIYVLIFSPNINGIKAWIKIGSLSFQPSELIKITFPLISIDLVKRKKYILNLILFIIPSILILLEPDTGNFILLLILYLYIAYNKKNKKIFKIIFIIILICTVSSIIVFKYKSKFFINFLNGKLYYRYKRLLNFDNIQITNGLISLASTKVLPINMNKTIIYIPEGITDFIFDFTAPNIGLILLLFLLISYILFIKCYIKKYKTKRFFFSKKLIGSFTILFSVQTIYNILMNIGFIPIMGIPLPFLSYGGSNIITYFIFLSIVNKKISSSEDMGNNNYKNNYHMVQMDKNN